MDTNLKSWEKGGSGGRREVEGEGRTWIRSRKKRKAEKKREGGRGRRNGMGGVG